MDLKINYEPHQYQESFHNACFRYKALISGIGGGKTLAGCIEAIDIMIRYPKSLGAILAPTYKMLSNTTKRTFFNVCPPELIKAYNKGDNTLIFTNGSEVIFLSGEEADKLRGPNLSWFYIDEASIVGEDVWRVMIGRLRIKPEVCWITCTPKGFNWVYREFIEHKRKDFWSVSYATSSNPHLSERYVKSLQENYSGVFLKQEFYGEFVGHEGLVYANFNRQFNIVKRDEVTSTFRRIIVGLDFGYTNPTGIVIAGLDSDDRIYIIEEFYEKGMLIDNLVTICKEYKRQYPQIEMFCCDPSEPAYIEQLQQNGINAQGVKCDILPSIAKVATRLDKKLDDRPRLFIQENCINLINEFQNYRYPEVKDNKAIKEKPIKLFDHLLDALRYAVWQVDEGIDYTKIPKINITDLTELM